jgi:hypothetical protein
MKITQNPAHFSKFSLQNVGLNLYGKNEINRKLRVATEIGSTFFWFLTSYRAAEIVQNDYLSSA